MKKQKTMDFITKLPDPVLSSIISGLPLREAVATSVLSRQWATIWRSLSHIDADPLLMMNVDKERYKKILKREKKRSYENLLSNSEDLFEAAISGSIQVIDYVLSCQEQHITSCRLVHYSHQDLFSNKIICWINLLKNRGPLQELSLTYRYLRRQLRFGEGVNPDDIFVFQPNMFHCRTLHKLELKKYQITSASPFESCDNIVTLILDSVKIQDRVLEQILSHCSSLEDLTLRYCDKLSSLKIRDVGLKRLEISDISVDEIHLSLGELIVLAIHNVTCDYDRLAIDCPNIRVLRASCEPDERDYKTYDKVLDQCSGLLAISRSYHPLIRKPYQEPCDNLRELWISFDMNNIKLRVLLRYIFSMTIHLHTLGITNQVTPSDCVNPFYELLYISWDNVEPFESVCEQLKTIQIKGFTGKCLEIKLVTYLLKNAANLKNLVIQCGDKCSKEGANDTLDLLSLSRASASARIMLEPCPSFQDKKNKLGFKSWVDTLR